MPQGWDEGLIAGTSSGWDAESVVEATRVENVESCLYRGYKVVMLSGSLQYAPDWEEQFRRIARAATEWLYISRLPIVEHAPTFAAVQRVYGSVMLHWQFNRSQMLGFVESLGFEIDREFEMGDRPYVKSAPEPCELRGWFFRRTKLR